MSFDTPLTNASNKNDEFFVEFGIAQIDVIIRRDGWIGSRSWVLTCKIIKDMKEVYPSPPAVCCRGGSEE